MAEFAIRALTFDSWAFAGMRLENVPAPTLAVMRVASKRFKTVLRSICFPRLFAIFLVVRDSDGEHGFRFTTLSKGGSAGLAVMPVGARRRRSGRTESSCLTFLDSHAIP